MSVDLSATARAIVAGNKGILAADESFPTIKKRFDAVNLESNERNRRDYRAMLFETPKIGDYIGGVILFDETIRQSNEKGKPLVKILEDAGVIPGIKVDKGAKPLALHGSEKVTEGLDGLRDRLTEYFELGARFTKWRGVYSIGEDAPSAACISANAHALARFAALSQECGLVPIVEPEVLMDGDHEISDCEVVTEEVLQAVFSELSMQDVELEGMLLKPNMVLSGKDCSEQASVEEVARSTVRTLLRTVPAAVPGIVFLSGGQSDEQATLHLDAINKLQSELILPWRLSFSYGRALQSTPLKAWAGNPEQVEAAQKAFLELARANALASTGQFQKAA